MVPSKTENMLIVLAVILLFKVQKLSSFFQIMLKIMPAQSKRA